MFLQPTSTSHSVKGPSSPHLGSRPNGHPHSKLGLGSLQALTVNSLLGSFFPGLETEAGLPNDESLRTRQDSYLTCLINATTLSSLVYHHESRRHRIDVVLAGVGMAPEAGAI